MTTTTATTDLRLYFGARLLPVSRGIYSVLKLLVALGHLPVANLQLLRSPRRLRTCLHFIMTLDHLFVDIDAMSSLTSLPSNDDVSDGEPYTPLRSMPSIRANPSVTIGESQQKRLEELDGCRCFLTGFHQPSEWILACHMIASATKEKSVNNN
jgi:hypothetical protein